MISSGIYKSCSWIDPRITVRTSPIHQRGLFSTSPISEGETIVIWGGVLFTEEEINQSRAAQHSYVCIDDGIYIGGIPAEGNSPDDFMNHSCDPNAWLIDEVTIVARKHILPNTEVTIDYATIRADYASGWTCHCGARFCRGFITEDDYQITDLQDRYMNHFSPIVNKLIGKHRVSLKLTGEKQKDF